MSQHWNPERKRKSLDTHHNLPQNHSKKQKLDPEDIYSIHSLRASKLESLPTLPAIAPEYERTVFTHASVASPNQSYENLEFLGDAYIEVIASRLIWSLYKDHGFTPAKMSQVRETLVKNETLSEFCLAYGLVQRLVIHPGSAPEGVGRIKVNGDVFEAYVAAVVLSDPVGGFERAEDWLCVLWEGKLKDVSTVVPDEVSKAELSKKIGAKGVKLEYVDERKPIIDKKRGIETYFIGVYLTGWGHEKEHLGSGSGQSKKAAGMNAAKAALGNSRIMNPCIAKKAELMEKRRAEEANGTENGGGG